MGQNPEISKMSIHDYKHVMTIECLNCDAVWQKCYKESYGCGLDSFSLLYTVECAFSRGFCDF